MTTWAKHHELFNLFELQFSLSLKRRLKNTCLLGMIEELHSLIYPNPWSNACTYWNWVHLVVRKMSVKKQRASTQIRAQGLFPEERPLLLRPKGCLKIVHVSWASVDSFACSVSISLLVESPPISFWKQLISHLLSLSDGVDPASGS